MFRLSTLRTSRQTSTRQGIVPSRPPSSIRPPTHSPALTPSTSITRHTSLGLTSIYLYIDNSLTLHTYTIHPYRSTTAATQQLKERPPPPLPSPPHIISHELRFCLSSFSVLNSQLSTTRNMYHNGFGIRHKYTLNSRIYVSVNVSMMSTKCRDHWNVHR